LREEVFDLERERKKKERDEKKLALFFVLFFEAGSNYKSIKSNQKTGIRELIIMM